ncbi:MAG: YceI family protein [Chitinophagaceae bacterium]|nr:YceI family protein [Chitinophagaceae bacterium]
MKKIIIALFAFASLQAGAQKYMTKAGSINFAASGPLEKIEGNNKSAACLLDTKTGALDFIVQIKSFVFDRQLMQEHFNENYLESEKFPKSMFKGSISNLSAINFDKDGEYAAQVQGKLTIHGVSKDVKTTGKVVVKNGKITLSSNFSVLLSDYGISIPGAVKDKVSKDAKITVNCTLDKMK